VDLAGNHGGGRSVPVQVATWAPAVRFETVLLVADTPFDDLGGPLVGESGAQRGESLVQRCHRSPLAAGDHRLTVTPLISGRNIVVVDGK
jgi:hypothetical protein